VILGNLKEIEMAAQVTIRCARSGYKFIVIENEKKEIIIFADDDPCYRYHRDLLAQYRQESGLRAQCLGGGRIAFDEKMKTIRIWDSSGDFGYEPSREDTVNMIRAAYPDFQVAAG